LRANAEEQIKGLADICATTSMLEKKDIPFPKEEVSCFCVLIIRYAMIL